jgi:hypothetical protein
MVEIKKSTETKIYSKEELQAMAKDDLAKLKSKTEKRNPPDETKKKLLSLIAEVESEKNSTKVKTEEIEVENSPSISMKDVEK